MSSARMKVVRNVSAGVTLDKDVKQKTYWCPCNPAEAMITYWPELSVRNPGSRHKTRRSDSQWLQT